jgi:hypothetical protein
MPIQVELIRENNVVLQTYSDPLDSAQINQLRDQMEHDILPTAQGKLHIIADFRGVKNLAGTVLSSGTTMLRNPHMNTGSIVAVTTNSFVGAMAHIFGGLVPRQAFKVVKSLDEAYAEIDTILAKTA